MEKKPRPCTSKNASAQCACCVPRIISIKDSDEFDSLKNNVKKEITDYNY